MARTTTDKLHTDKTAQINVFGFRPMPETLSLPQLTAIVVFTSGGYFVYKRREENDKNTVYIQNNEKLETHEFLRI